jgi:hypothetical protein
LSKRNRRKRPRFHRRTTPGAAPGVVAVDPRASKPRVVATSYGVDDVEQVEVKRIHDIAQLRGRRQVLWVDVEGLGDAETIRHLGRMFGLHSLALEDVVNVHQQVKVENYGDHLFLVGRLVDDTEHGHTEQVSVFLGKDFVVTFQESPGDWLAPVRERVRNPHSRRRRRCCWPRRCSRRWDTRRLGTAHQTDLRGRSPGVPDLRLGDEGDRLHHRARCDRRNSPAPRAQGGAGGAGAAELKECRTTRSGSEFTRCVRG